MELNFKVPPLRKEIQPSSSSSSTSSCLNCVRLQRRVKELEEKLFRLTVEQEHMETSPVFSKTSVLSNQVLQSPEPVHTEEEGTGCKFKAIKDETICQSVKDKSQPVLIYRATANKHQLTASFHL